MTAPDTDSDWSVPRTEVMAAARRFVDADRGAVLATIVDVEGSAYRRPGAKMVVPEDGGGVGHITAGCLEGEVQSLAASVLADGSPRLETYDLMEGDDDVWGLGVGCNGVVDILLEPLDESFRPAVEAFESGGRVGVVTVLDAPATPAGTRAYYDPDADAFAGDELPDALAATLRDPAATLADRGRAATVAVEADGDTATVFVDGVVAPPDLVVVGSGHDVGPVVELGRKNDFRVTVVGFRGAVDLESRFPAADEVVSTSPARLREAVTVDERTAVVVATHNFVDDRIAVDELLRTDVEYVGLMGPHERFEEMLAEFRQEDRTFSEAELEKLYTPVGLDLGGGTPYRIAHSIVAEVLAVHNDRTPGHLRERDGSIHERLDVEASPGSARSN